MKDIAIKYSQDAIKRENLIKYRNECYAKLDPAAKGDRKRAAESGRKRVLKRPSSEDVEASDSKKGTKAAKSAS
eukprot:9251853-Alexandrium_andersonii.AAC.1